MFTRSICQYAQKQQYLLMHNTVCWDVSVDVVVFNHTDKC